MLPLSKGDGPTRVLGEAVYVEKVLKNTAAKRDRESGIFLFSEGRKRVKYLPILKYISRSFYAIN